MEEATGGQGGGVWQPPVPDMDGDGGEPAPDGMTVLGRTPAAEGPEVPGSENGTGDHTLDIAPVAVVESAAPTQAASTPAGGTATLPPGLDGSRPTDETKKTPPKAGRRRTSVALLTAGGVIALAAAPFAMVSPTEHIVGESASSTSKEHPKPAAKKPAPGRTLAAPVPSWQTQSPPGQPGGSQPAPWEPAPGTPSPSPTQPGFQAPSPSPSESPTKAADPTPTQSPQGGDVRTKGHDGTGSDQVKRSPASPARTTPADNQATRTLRASGQNTAPEHKAKPKTNTASPNGETRVIHDTYVLNPGQEVHTNRIRLTLQADGNLVLEDANGAVVWSTGTNASGTHAVFQADGNFVLYSSSQETLWSTRTDGHDGAVLVMRGDGDLAIVQGDTTLWKTNTAK